MASKVEAYFIDFPKSKKCFETSDGYIFHQLGDANIHAGSLKAKNVKTHERPFEKEPEDEVAEVGKKATKPNGKDKATEAAK